MISGEMVPPTRRTISAGRKGHDPGRESFATAVFFSSVMVRTDTRAGKITSFEATPSERSLSPLESDRLDSLKVGDDGREVVGLVAGDQGARKISR